MRKRLTKGMVAVVFAIAVLLPARAAFAQADSLAASLGTQGSNGAVSLNLNLSSAAGSGPVGIQWTLSYPASSVTSISASLGSIASTAGKTLACFSGSGAYTCMVSGVNTTTIPSGTIAVVNLTMAAGATNTSIGIAKADASSAMGATIGVSGAGVVVPGSAPAAPSLSSLSCAPSTVSSSGITTCTVTLSGAAPAGGTTVALSSSNSLLPVAASVTVPANASSSTFTATAGAIPSAQSATVTATIAGVNSVTATVQLTASAAPPSTTSIWSSSAVPAVPWQSDSPVTVGVKFRSDVSGNITGIRFYKGAGNNGTHTGLLYTAAGALLAEATFTGETASGWQQVSFATPVAISANTVYVAAYFSTSGYAVNNGYFASSGADNPPLHALQSGVDGLNGVYGYGSAPEFPSSSYEATNYWADVVFSAASPTTSIWSSSAVPAIPWQSDSPVTVGVKFRSDVSGSIMGIRFYKGAGNTGTHTGLLYGASGTLLAQATFTGETASGWQQVSFSTPVEISANTVYVAAYFTTSGYAVNNEYYTSAGVDNAPLHALQSGVDGLNGVYAYGSGPEFPSLSYEDSNYWADVVFSAATTSIWSSTAVPAVPWQNDSPVTLGVKFQSDVSGSVVGIRFYKGAGNNGTHIGLLYNSSGTLLAQATFTGETASGWQQVSFATPVAISANTVYIAAYFSTSGYAVTNRYFLSSGVDNAPLHALQAGVDGVNGVYAYGSAPEYPTSCYADSNYWADVLFSTAP